MVEADYMETIGKGFNMERCLNCDYLGELDRGLCVGCLTEYEVLSRVVKANTPAAPTGIIFKQYKEAVRRTESPDFFDVDQRVLHGAIGCATEAGGLLDAIKKSLFYGRELNLINVFEELGDLLWYITLICDACDWSMEQVIDANIEKLRARYPEQFSTKNEQERDLKAEEEVLEEKEKG